MRTRPLLVSAASLAVVSGVVLQSSTAAFTATTGTTGGWAAGAIALADNDNESALFDHPNLAPGATGSRCLKVTYTGDRPANMRFYAAIVTKAGRAGGLGEHLTMTVTRGVGSALDCSDFSGTTVVFQPGKLTALVTAHPDYATSPERVDVANNATHTYRFEWQLSSVQADVQGKDVDASFTWEARTA